MSYDSGYAAVSYGGYGSNSGGGFVTTGYGATESVSNNETKFSSPSGGDRTLPEAKTRSRPVTIKQINSATQVHADAEFNIDDVEVAIVTFVGIVRNVLSLATNSVYRIEDGTGTCEIRQFRSPQQQNQRDQEVQFPQPGDYVRVIGELKTFGGKRHIVCHRIRPIKDYNEVIYAQLEALYVHLQYKGKRTNDSTEMNVSTINNMTDSMTTSRSYVNEDLTALQKKIMDIMTTAQEQSSNEGAHIHIIADRAGASIATIQRTCEELSEMGLVYTTIDYDHYKLT
ncbi:hypothetical protein V1511DRAFT_517179 [Dipodascopsis uninucleata]